MQTPFDNKQATIPPKHGGGGKDSSAASFPYDENLPRNIYCESVFLRISRLVAAMNHADSVSLNAVGAILSRGNLPEHLLAFIAGYIHSVIELESLLLLHQDRTRSWSPAELARELRIDEQFARQEIAELSSRGLAQCDSDNTCHYAPSTAELDQAVTELAQVYLQRRVTVIEAIYARPTDPIQSFADAFRFRRGKPNG